LVDKGSLDDLMEIQKRVAEIQALQIGIQIAQGLEAAAQKGLVHSDVKPGNILFADPTDAKIVDFGLAELMEQEATEKGEVWGTPYYVSPERLNRQQEDFRSDMYSLGATLFHAITGRPPFEAETASLVALRHIRSRAVSLQAFAPDVSSETAYVINRMLKREPDERYSSYAELIDHLRYARNKLEEKAGVPGRQRVRVVVEDKDTQNFTAWLTLGALAAALVLAALIYFNWGKDRKRTAKVVAPPPAAAVQQAKSTAVQQYEEARGALANSEFGQALEMLRAVKASGPLKQPLRSWVNFHEGLALFFLGRSEEAAEVFAGLEKAGMYSMDPAELPTAKFILETSRLAASSQPIRAGVSNIYDKQGIEALALLVFGIKEWQKGSIMDGGALLEEFVKSNPSGQFEWINAYKKSANRFVEEYKVFAEARKLMMNARSADEKAAALEKLESMKGRLTTGSAIRKEFDSLAQGVIPAVAERPAPAPTATPWAFDEGATGTSDANLRKARENYAKLVSRYKFPEALAAIDSSRPSDPSQTPQWEATRKKAEWLVSFKRHLIEGLNAHGYKKPVSRKTGGTVSGEKVRADAAKLTFALPYGSVLVEWEELAPDTIIAMANEVAKNPKFAVSKAEWLWLTGVFAYETGNEKEGRRILLEASQQADEHKDHLALFFQAAQNP
jgi:hypothetical protein